jgi:ferredoxin
MCGEVPKKDRAMSRILVDVDLCQGHGVCESEAPEIFEVGKDRKVIVNEPPAEALADPGTRRSVDLAINYCPTHALSLLAEADGPGLPNRPPQPPDNTAARQHSHQTAQPPDNTATR